MKRIIRKLVPSFVVNWYHLLLAFSGALIYGFPSKKLKVIGVTGTNGKSTVIEMTSKILETAGFKIATLSSIKFKIADEEQPNMLKMTMPGKFILQRFLRQAVNSGCQYAVIEVTSEGIKQYRHRFIKFDTAVFTNLSPEHIEAHGSFENYRQAKEEFFAVAKGIHILNIDDKNVEYFLKYNAEKKYKYGLLNNGVNNKEYEILATKYKADASGISFQINDIDFKLDVLGTFNIYNALASICIALSENISLEVCRDALKKIKIVPGRMEMVISAPFKVIVDYAFTPNALEKVYATVKNNFKPENLICVLGAAGGGRDKWKRPILGKIAAKYCQHIIITNEDPYDENPEDIIDQIAKGIKAEKIIDREKAIHNALKKAGDNDVIIITGKGCEPWICIEKGKKIPWDDRKIVKQEFERLNYGIKK